MAFTSGIYKLDGSTYPSDCINWAYNKLSIDFIGREGVVNNIDKEDLIKEMFEALEIDIYPQPNVSISVSSPPIITIKWEDIVIGENPAAPLIYKPQDMYSLIRVIDSIKDNDDDPVVSLQALNSSAEALVSASNYLPVPTCNSDSNKWQIHFDVSGGNLLTNYSTYGKLSTIVRNNVLMATNGTIDLLSNTYSYVTFHLVDTSDFYIEIFHGSDTTKHLKAAIGALIYNICSRGLFGTYELLYGALALL